jgi:hypothetical protein
MRSTIWTKIQENFGIFCQRSIRSISPVHIEPTRCAVLLSRQASPTKYRNESQPGPIRSIAPQAPVALGLALFWCRFRSRTPGPPPFSSMNSTSVLSHLRLIYFALFPFQQRIYLGIFPKSVHLQQSGHQIGGGINCLPGNSRAGRGSELIHVAREFLRI